MLNKIKVIGTGSKGNSYILYFDEKTIMLDCGLPYKLLESYTDIIDYCIITHDHKDHSLSASKLKDKVVQDNKDFTTFDVKHKGGNKAYMFNIEKEKILYLTDTSKLESLGDLSDLNYLLIECNWDYFKIKNLPFTNPHITYACGPEGHMSNIDTLNFIADNNIKAKTKILLVHCSRTNGSPEMFKVFEALPNKWLIAQNDLTVYCKNWVGDK